MKHTRLLSLLLTAAAALSAGPVLTEGFDDITTLAGSGWVLTNNSLPIGTIGFAQGNSGVFPAQAGATNSYIAANFESAALGGNISNWLILPALTLTNGDTMSFYTQSAGGGFADRLEVRLNTSATTNVGATDASVGDFTTLLLSINNTLDPNGYPNAWTQFSVTMSGLAGPTNLRLALRYFVTDTNVNGNYIGIDSLIVDTALPEPASFLLIGAGLAGLALLRRRF